MREIIKEYGLTTITVIAIISIMTWLFVGMRSASGDVGLLAIMKEQVTENSAKELSSSAVEAVSKTCQVGKSCSVQVNNAICGRDYDAESLIEIRNNAGKLMVPEIRGIYLDRNKENQLEQYMDDAHKKVRFELPGIYRLMVYSSDDGGGAMAGEVYLHVVPQ